MNLTRSDVYGGGRTTDATTRSAAAPASPASTGPMSSASAVANSAAGLRGINPLLGAGVVVGGLIGYKLLREWGRDHDADKDIKVAAHNGFVITLFALAGIPLAKGIINAVTTNAPKQLQPYLQPVRDYTLNA